MSVTYKTIEPGAQDYLNYIASQMNCNYHLNSVMELEGLIDEEILQRAIRLLIKEEPILGCRFVPDDDKPYWETRSDLDKIDLCTVVHTENTTEDVLNFVNRPINEGIDPLFDVCIFRGPATDTLCVKLSHVCADGRGTKDFLERLNCIYNNIAVDPTFKTGPNRGTRDQTQIFQYISEEDFVKSWFDDSNTDSKLCMFPYVSYDNEKNQSSLAVQYLNKEEFQKIRLRGKELGATVNDILITALFRALWRFDQIDKRVKTIIGCTVDLRQYLPKKGTDTICNLSSLFTIGAEKNVSESFVETLQRITNETKRLKDSMLGANFPFVHEVYARLGLKEMFKYMTQDSKKKKGNKLPAFVFSNLGVMGSGKMNWNNTAVQNLYITGPALNPPSSLIVATTYDGVLSLTFFYSKLAVSQKIADTFLLLVFAEMQSLID